MLFCLQSKVLNLHMLTCNANWIYGERWTDGEPLLKSYTRGVVHTVPGFWFFTNIKTHAC